MSLNLLTSSLHTLMKSIYLKFFEQEYTVIIFSNYDPDDIEPIATTIRKVMIGETDQSNTTTMKQ